MKACAALFGIVVGVIAVASPIRSSGGCDAAEGAPGLSSESISRSPPPGALLQHPPEAQLFDHLTSWDYDSKGRTEHLSCDDVCKKEPKLFRVFDVSTGFPPPSGDDKIAELSARVEQILDTDGWKECKSIDRETSFSDTYSKDGRLLEVNKSFSNGVGGSLGIVIAVAEIKPAGPLPSNVPIPITLEWKTYRNASLGFEISYPPDWRVISVEAGYGAITIIGNCYKENCLRMRLAPAEYGGDAFQIVISPEKIYRGISTPEYPEPPSTDYAIGPYPTWADRQESSWWETCERSIDLWTTLGDYRYEFRPGVLVPNSFKMKDVYGKILSTVKVTPVYLGTGAERPAPPVR